ncbi:MAG: HNH endonuclease [Akkermansia sp.]|nr:HNH endonuclease [Akkermansia sp.]
MKTITNFTRYIIDKDGDIYSTISNKFLKLSVMPSGYQKVTLRNDEEEAATFLVHRLVWEVFNGPIPEGMTVNHKDENKLNNSLSNLELMTMAENANYGSRNERISKSLKKYHAQKRLALQILTDLTQLLDSAEPLEN